MVHGAGDRRFSRHDRLRSRRDFERLAREGERRASGDFVVFVSTGARRGRDDAGERPRLGVTASRKVGNAVVRNRVKRRIRAAFRTQRALLPRGSDVVVIARPSVVRLSGRDVEAALSALFRPGRAR